MANAYRRANVQQRRYAARLACEQAVAESFLGGATVSRALESLNTISANMTLAKEMEALAARLDEEYLAQSERGKALRLFVQARAAAALAFALVGDGSLHEAIYEATAALQEPSRLAGLVTAALRGA